MRFLDSLRSLEMTLKNFLSEHEQIKDDENENQNAQSDECLGEALWRIADQKQHWKAQCHRWK